MRTVSLREWKLNKHIYTTHVYDEYRVFKNNAHLYQEKYGMRIYHFHIIVTIIQVSNIKHPVLASSTVYTCTRVMLLLYIHVRVLPSN